MCSEFIYSIQKGKHYHRSRPSVSNVGLQDVHRQMDAYAWVKLADSCGFYCGFTNDELHRVNDEIDQRDQNNETNDAHVDENEYNKHSKHTDIQPREGGKHSI